MYVITATLRSHRHCVYCTCMEGLYGYKWVNVGFPCEQTTGFSEVQLSGQKPANAYVCCVSEYPQSDLYANFMIFACATCSNSAGWLAMRTFQNMKLRYPRVLEPLMAAKAQQMCGLHSCNRKVELSCVVRITCHCGALWCVYRGGVVMDYVNSIICLYVLYVLTGLLQWQWC